MNQRMRSKGESWSGPRLLQYEYECIENMEWVESDEHFINSKQTTALISLFPEIIDLSGK